MFNKKLLLVLLHIIAGFYCFSQSAPNVSGNTPLPANTEAAGKFSAASVNLYTGQLGVSVPIYSYSNNNGLNLSIDLNYTGSGGIKLAETPSQAGLGWYLNTGGIITRTVQGVPDDLPQKGFLYTPVIPNDFRADGDKYYNDTLDTQQDVFQFSIPGHSGKFYIRRNRDIIQVPLSPLKIVPVISNNQNDGQIKSFTITAENGVRYVFKDCEANVVHINNSKSGYVNTAYNSAWNLTYIISSFSQDTIQYKYTSVYSDESFSYPVIYYLPSPFTSQSGSYFTTGSNGSGINDLNYILLPNGLRIDFIKSSQYICSGTNCHAIEKILISDTIFRKGFLLDYYNINKILLKSITPYTAAEKHKGYNFFYNMPYLNLAPLRNPDDLSSNTDNWGYYIGGTVTYAKPPNKNWAERQAQNLIAEQGSVLNRIVFPEGGSEAYQYELNNTYPCSSADVVYTVPVNTLTSRSVSLWNIFSNNHVLSIRLDTSLVTTGNPPLSGSCNFMCKIKSAVSPYQELDSVSIPLRDLYYTGLKFWTTSVADGNYILETKFKGTGSVTTPFNVSVSWVNKQENVNAPARSGGGIRIRKIVRVLNATDTAGVFTQEFKYITPDGRSSGIIAEPGTSAYHYKDIYADNSTGNEKSRLTYTFVNQEPGNVTDFSQGSHIGYSRVEVIKGTSAKNIGKEVTEFTTLKESRGELNIPDFPYGPAHYNAWALGLPKATYTYDNNGTLLRKTVMVYDVKNISYNNDSDKNIKMGQFAGISYQDALNHTLSQKSIYVAQEYYPSTGRVFATAVYDTTYFSNGSTFSSQALYDYDETYFTLKKLTKTYNRKNNLNLETRYYYPQDYTINGSNSWLKKLRDSGIISSPISAENWITGDANPRLLSANITYWQVLANNNVKPFQSYALESSQPVSQSIIGTFDPAQLNRNNTYFKIQTEISYDEKSNPVQVMNKTSGQAGSVIMGYNKLYKVAEVSNAVTNDIAYTGFETDSDGGWQPASGIRNNTLFFTGKKSYNLGSGNIIRSGLTASQTYYISVWGKASAAISVNGTLLTNALTAQNNWNLYAYTITGITQVTVSGSGTIDELRLHPIDANMVTYTYDPTVGVTAQADANNTLIRKEYDNMNRPSVIRDKDNNIIQKYQYSDSIYPVSINPIWAGSGINCGDNFTYDSIYVNQNIFSNNYLSTKTVTPQHFDSCVCLWGQYKCINGKAELGIRVNESCIQIDWQQYQCTYHYEWSDCSKTDSYPEMNTRACPVRIRCH